ncbi:MAG TPA: hypothetical protein VN650_17960 [Gemmatimonadaceae bacterium]|nr:hypothetical protein [Gemmatimonadaceae bacterium]
MEIFVLGVALLLPWAVGAVWLHALQSGSPRTPLLQPIAYGHLGGILVLTLLMRAMSAIGVRWSFMTLSLILVALLVAGIAIGSRLGHKLKSGDPRPVAHIDPFPWRWLGIMAAILLVFRMGNLAYEVLLQPIYPWDAWTQWATKAKVWSALHTMAPFIDYSQWLARQPGYVDTASHYPATVPLMQAWMSLALGRFDDALINLPWLTLCVALAAGIYAQARALRVAASWAMFITYAALSLPMLDTHVALAGYADLYVGAVFALAVMSLLRWERSREGIQLVYLVISIALLPTLKVPGVVWAATLLLGLLVAAFGRTRGRVAAITLSIAAATAVSVVALFRGKLVSVTGQAQGEVVQPLFDNLFLFDNWHLLWYVLPIALAIGWRDAIHRSRGTSATLVAGFVFLWATFALTRAGNWVADYSTVNRALLHIAPAALVFGAVLVWEWAIRREVVSPIVELPIGDQPYAAASISKPVGP